ncbi:hypothetical protein [Streptomyces sp. NBC_00582]|uniref:hypothetical protein n=1 Tax=Streptomyces sp. NBC_00582 TaxID=2975783 RepID=UPI0010E61556|nr:hypothetical protein [Streptomyces sp. NBC_00582]WUB64708.1 hypothetical protein OG852_32025 [Streptomyces sp. NBC_00582]
MPGQDHESLEGYDGIDAVMADALMAAITGDALPDESRADPARLAAHRSATADVALLREQLALLAEALTEPAEKPAPAVVRPLRRPRTRVRPFALRAVGAAAAAALVFGAGWVVVQQIGSGVAGVQSSSDSGAKAAAGAEDAGTPLGDSGYLACLRLVVEGEVTAVREVPGTDEARITLRVTHAYKPEKAPRDVRFVLPRDMDPLVARGDRVLVALPRGSSSPDVWAVGEADIAPEREALARALPRSTESAATAGPACGA